MNKVQFDYMCNTYGDPTLSNNEKWKSVAYIATTTTLVPTFSAQYYLRTNQFNYSEKFGEPGFFLIDYLYSPHGPFSNKQGLTVTFIPLSMITAIAFTSKTSFSNGNIPTVEPQKPDIIIGFCDLDADSSKIYNVISTSDDGENNGASPDLEYNIIYTGLGANAADDSSLDLLYPTTSESTNENNSDFMFSLDENGSNPNIETDDNVNEVI